MKSLNRIFGQATATSEASAWARCLLALLLGAVFAPAVRAFPPAPHHLFFGTVRDQYGTPLRVANAEVILEAAGGTVWKTKVVSGVEPTVNYRLAVPMDAGLTSDLYQPTALRPAMPFTIRVKIDNVTYLPLQLKGSFLKLGLPGQQTRLDLTLGEDSDGDGLPDAWERLINADLAQVHPGDDSDGDGMSNLQEYLAGTYAFDPENGFALQITEVRETGARMKFTSVRGRSYRLEGSMDLKEWEPASFRIPAEGANGNTRSVFVGSAVRLVEVEAIKPADQPETRFYRLMVE
jgi:Bacterial TSP3 repeat